MSDFGVSILVLVAFLGGMCVGAFGCSDGWKDEAVKHGAAEYILDPATGKTTWQWKKGEVKR